MRIMVFFLLALLAGEAASGQESKAPLVREKNLVIGFSVGGFLANKHTGYRYDGSDIEYDGLYDYGFQKLLFNAQIQNQISNELGLSNTDFSISEFPDPARYRPAVSIGLTAGYYVSEPLAFFVEGIFTRLNLNNVLVLEYDNPSSTLTQVTYENAIVRGREQRFDLNAGIHLDLNSGEQLMFYTELAASINSTRALHNEVQVRSLKYVLTSFNRTTNAYPLADWGGMGFGGSGGLGMRYKFNQQITFDIGGTVMYQKINLAPEQFQRFKPQYLFYIRALWL